LTPAAGRPVPHTEPAGPDTGLSGRVSPHTDPAGHTAPRTGHTASVGAVVVNYNAARHIGPCLASLAAEGVKEVVVVDNASTDGSRAVVAASGTPWVDAGENLGYGRAANLGAAAIPASSADYLLICNPDLVIQPGAVKILADHLDANPGTGLVGPRLCNPDGSLYPSARVFPDMVDAMGHGLLGQMAPANRFTRRYRLLDWDHSRSAQVDWVSGACFMVRQEAWAAVKGFDPAYFMYLEDVDLCWRIGRRGWAIAYEPSAEVVHVQGVSADQHPYRMLLAHHRSMWRFALRTTGGARRAALPVVGAGLLARLALESVRRRIRGSTHGTPPGPLP
jgi:N-acetylglucosaminyl-diphospho-decaprenol L-rhamnosyltransferase